MTVVRYDLHSATRRHDALNVIRELVPAFFVDGWYENGAFRVWLRHRDDVAKPHIELTDNLSTFPSPELKAKLMLIAG